LALVLLPSLSRADGISRVELLAGSCLTCHGPTGEGSGKIPELKGEDVSDLTDSLQGFHDGTERSTIMNRLVEGYTEEELTMLAKYFAQMK
jgi:sulfide dehydrogenase cytochrome subunit